MNKNQKLIRNLVFIAFYVAIAIVLEYISGLFPGMPNGGTLELQCIALFIASFHLGAANGVSVSLLVFALEAILGLSKYFITPIQIALDYVIPLCACGLGAIFPKIGKDNVVSGILGGMFFKYLSHVLVGAYIWFGAETETAGSLGAWLFSLNYNLWYCLFTLIVVILVVPGLIRAISHLHSVELKGIKK